MRTGSCDVAGICGVEFGCTWKREIFLPAVSGYLVYENLYLKHHCHGIGLCRGKIHIYLPIAKNSWSDAKQNISKYVPRPHNKASTNGPLSDICNVMSFYIIGGLLQSYVTKPDRD